MQREQLSCEQFERRLNDVLDERRNPRHDETLAEHLSACKNCRGLAGAYEIIVAGITQLPRDARGCRNEPVVPVVPRRAVLGARMLAGFSLVAAGVVAFVLMMPKQNPSITPAAAYSTIVAAAPPTATKQASLRTPIVGNFARQTRTACVEFVQGTARSLDEAVALATALPPPNDLLQPVLFSEDGILRQLEHDLAPMADETLDVLRNVFTSDHATRL